MNFQKPIWKTNPPDGNKIKRYVFLEASTLYGLDVSVNWLLDNMQLVNQFQYRIHPNGDYTCALYISGPENKWDLFNKNVRCRVKHDSFRVVIN